MSMYWFGLRKIVFSPGLSLILFINRSVCLNMMTVVIMDNLVYPCIIYQFCGFSFSWTLLDSCNSSSLSVVVISTCLMHSIINSKFPQGGTQNQESQKIQVCFLILGSDLLIEDKIFPESWVLYFRSWASPEGPCTEGLVSSLWCYCDMVKPSRGGAQLEEIRSLGKCLWSLPSIMRWVPSFVTHFYHDVLGFHRTKATVPRNWFEISETVGPNKLSLLLSWLSLLFCHSNRRLTNTGRIGWSMTLLICSPTQQTWKKK